MISDSFHVSRTIYISLRYITSIRQWVYRIEERCLIAEYQNAINQTFLATGNRGGRNCLFVHSASLRECTSRGVKRLTRVVTNPGRVSDNAPTLPLIPSPAQAPSEEEAYEIPPTAFPRLLLRPLQVSFPIPFLPPPRPFSLSRHVVGFSCSSCKIRDDLTQATKRTCAHASSCWMTKRGKKEIPRVEEEKRRVLGLVRHFTCVRTAKG